MNWINRYKKKNSNKYMHKTITATKVKDGFAVKEVKRFSVQSYTELKTYCRQNGLVIRKGICDRDENGEITGYYAD